MSWWVTFKEPIKLAVPTYDPTGATPELRMPLKEREFHGACVHGNAGRAMELFPRQEGEDDPWEKRNDWLENEAAAYAGLIGPVESINYLPYGAFPSVDTPDFGDFCSTPEQCQGRSSCPKSYACSE